MRFQFVSAVGRVGATFSWTNEQIDQPNSTREESDSHDDEKDGYLVRFDTVCERLCRTSLEGTTRAVRRNLPHGINCTIDSAIPNVIIRQRLLCPHAVHHIITSIVFPKMETILLAVWCFWSGWIKY